MASQPAFKASNIPLRGFTVIYEPGNPPDHDIVLIHGLQGHPYRTWACKAAQDGVASEKPHKTRLKFARPSSKVQAQPDALLASKTAPGEIFWPADFLPQHFPSSRILVYGYDSHVSHFFKEAAQQNNIFTLGRDMLQELAMQRRSSPRRPLIFLVHSLGGLVLKEALRRADKATEENQDLAFILQSTVSILFFGTPHRGSAYASIGLTACRIMSMAGFSVNDANLQSLKGNSGALEMLREEFVTILDKGGFLVSTFQEGTGPTKSGLLDRKVVDSESSGLDHRFERKFAFAQNHMDMCRFSSKSDPDYQKIPNEIFRHLERWYLARSEKQEKYLTGLYIPEMYLRFEQVETAYTKTLSWPFKEGARGPGFVEWLQNGTDLFWISGKPGSGKSTAMKNICTSPLLLPHLKNTTKSDWHVHGIFFTDRGDEIQHSWFGMLSAMLHGILHDEPLLSRLVVDFVETEAATKPLINVSRTANTAFSWSIDLLQRSLLFCKEQQKVPFQVCFFIDALDEHAGDPQAMGEFLKLLGESISSSPCRVVKICTASRPLPEFEDLFDHCPSFRMQDWTKPDIASYTKGRLESNKAMQRLILDHDTQPQAKALIDSIVERANGVFLWIRLVIDELSQSLTDGIPPSALMVILEEIPSGLDEFFFRMLSKIRVRYRYLAFILFETVLKSIRPLTISQMRLILKVNHKDQRESELASNITDLKNQIWSYTGGLVEVVPRYTTFLYSTSRKSSPSSSINGYSLHSDSEVEVNKNRLQEYALQPLHQTVKEFLRRNKNLEILRCSRHKPEDMVDEDYDGHFFLLSTYQYFLEHRDLQEPRPFSDSEIVQQIEVSSVPYAEKAKRDCYHLLASLEILLGSHFGKNATIISRMHDADSGYPAGWNHNFLAFAVFSNIYWFVEVAFERRASSTFWFKPGAPLIFYAACGHTPASEQNTFDFLLEKGAVASEKFYDIIWELNMDALGALVNYAMTVSNSTGIYEYRITQLLKHGADPTAPSGLHGNDSLLHTIGMCSLSMKVYEKFSIIQKLLEYGASIKSKNSTGLEIIDILIEVDDRLTEPMWSWLIATRFSIPQPTALDVYRKTRETYWTCNGRTKGEALAKAPPFSMWITQELREPQELQESNSIFKRWTYIKSLGNLFSTDRK